jgi:putative nucleotidyltransferase with HDIG domain
MNKSFLLLKFSVICIISLLLFGMAFDYILTTFIERNEVEHAKQLTARLVSVEIKALFTQNELLVPKQGQAYEQFSRRISPLLQGSEYVQVRIWNDKQVVIWSNDQRLVGQQFSDDEELHEAIAGETKSEISSLQKTEEQYVRKFHRLLELYVPIRFVSGQPITTVAEVYQNLDPMYDDIRRQQALIWKTTSVGFTLLYLLLFGIMWRASRLIETQTKDIIAAYDSTLAGWAHALDLRDKETEGHSKRVTQASLKLAQALGVGHADLVHIRRGALLHDIGKIGIPDRILHKPGPLDADEWEIMRRHPGYGYEMLTAIPYLHPALDIPYYHHERWDGSGYPCGLRGEQIPLAARLFAIIDVWDALSYDRPYRHAWPKERVRAFLAEQSGIMFDPNIISVFLALLDTPEFQSG